MSVLKQLESEREAQSVYGENKQNKPILSL